MGENSRFDFCPKCGALAKDGVCQSCGYQNSEIIQLLQTETEQPTMEQPVAAYTEEPAAEQSAPAPAEQPESSPAEESVAEQPAEQAPSAAEQNGNEQQIYGQFSGQMYGQPVNPAQQAGQSQINYSSQPEQGYYGGQQAGPAQGYYTGQQAGQAQGYYTGQQAGQAQGYYTGQQAGQAQGYYGGQQAGQAQGYYTGQQAGQPQGYYGGQQTGQPQGYYGGQQTGQAQGYYGGQQAGQAQGYYGGQQTGQPQGYYTGQQGQQQSYYAGQAQGYYTGQQAGQVQQPYSGYAPAVPPETAGGKTKKGTVALLCVVLGFVLLAVIILILVGLYNLQDNDKGDARQDRDRDRETSEEYTEETESEESKPDDDHVVDDNGTSDYNYTYEHLSWDATASNWDEEGQDESLPFYSGPYNALRDDLSYEISFTNEAYYSRESSAVNISVEYPQIISGDIPHVDKLNEQLRYEYDYYYETFINDFTPLMTSTTDYYYCVIDSYVTYMDEDILSVVYKENVYLNLQDDPFQMLDYYCVNIDLKTGTVLQNTEILNADEAFVATLREKELIENESRVLDYFSDAEIIDMLEDEGDLVFFYTPMGIEVGLNLSESVIYFMYDDYQQFLNTF